MLLVNKLEKEACITSFLCIIQQPVVKSAWSGARGTELRNKSNNEVASINSNNLSRLGLFPEHYIDFVLSNFSFNLQEKTQVKRY